MLRNTFTVCCELVFDFHAPPSSIVVHINTKPKPTVNSECTHSTETAFCTKEEKDAQVNNSYFLLLQDFTLISLNCIREPYTHLQLKQQRRLRAPPQCTHTLTLSLSLVKANFPDLWEKVRKNLRHICKKKHCVSFELLYFPDTMIIWDLT